MELVFSSDGQAYRVPPEVLEQHQIDKPEPREEVSLLGGQILVQVFWTCDFPLKR